MKKLLALTLLPAVLLLNSCGNQALPADTDSKLSGQATKLGGYALSSLPVGNLSGPTVLTDANQGYEYTLNMLQPASVDRVEWYLGNQRLSTQYGYQGTYYRSIGIQGLNSGTYTLTAKVYDWSGNVVTRSLNLKVSLPGGGAGDTQAPVLNVSGPAQLDPNTRLDIQMSMSDNVQLSTLRYSIDGGETSSIAMFSPGTTAWNYTFSWWPGSQRGVYRTFTFYLTDTAGNVTTKTHSVYLKPSYW